MTRYVARPWDTYIAHHGVAATLYDNDAQGHPLPVNVVLSNARYVSMLGTSRGELVLAQFPSETDGQPLVVSPGQVVHIPSVALHWFLVVKTLVRNDTRVFKAATLCSLAPLPRLISVTHFGVFPVSQLNAYDEPVIPDDKNALLHDAQSLFPVRAALANDFDPLLNEDTGQTPRNLTTVVVPLGSGVQKADQVILPDGRVTLISQVDHLYADGIDYGLKLILMGALASN